MRGSEGGPEAPAPDEHPVTVRMGAPADASTAASLHAELITEGFLSSLGPRFLARLYGRIAASEGSFLLIAECDGSRIGFIAGSVSVGRLYRSFLLRDGVAASLSAPLRLITALPRVLETLRHGRAGGEGEAGGELLAVAVDPRWRGRRVGLALVQGFLGQLERRGLSSAHVVVGADNAPALALYREAGFSVARTFEFHRGTASVLMETAVPHGAVPNSRPAS
jgi:ribosomal protein S18 acetylase RimI-like enzyme